MKNITQTVEAAVNLAPETFTMRDLIRLMRRVSPTLLWNSTSPYHALERLEKSGIVRSIAPSWKTGGKKTWQRLRKSAEQAELKLEPVMPVVGMAAPAPAPPPIPTWKPVKRGRVLRAVREIVFVEFARDAVFDAKIVEERIRRRWPALAEQMSGSAVRSALVNMERRRLLARAPTIGPQAAWRRIR